MVTTTKDPSKCKMIDALRIKKYLGCFIYKNRTLPLNEFVKKGRAPIEHLFNCHEWCDSEWCYAKDLTEKSHERTMNLVNKVSLCSIIVYTIDIILLYIIICILTNVILLYIYNDRQTKML